MDPNYSWARLPLSARRLNVTSTWRKTKNTILGPAAVPIALITVIASLIVGAMIAKDLHTTAVDESVEAALKNHLMIKQRLVDERGPLKRRIRRLRDRENLKFRICPVDNGTVLETIAEVNLDVLRGAHRKSRVLRSRLPSSLLIMRSAKVRRRALCTDFKYPRKPLLPLFLSFCVGSLIGLAVFVLPRMTRLYTLMAVMRRIAKGDYQARVHDPGDGTIGQLAKGVDQIGQRIEKLLAAQRHLHASVSHELRTPLARIAAAIDLAEDRPNPQLFEGMRADIDELDGMVEELLTLARLQDPQARNIHVEVDLVALVNQRVQAAQRGAAPALDWILEVPESASCHGDFRLLARLLDNLLSNALRHTQSLIAVTLSRDSESWVLKVADDGPGIHPDQIKFIFTPFVSGIQGGSAGLGLAICREIADRHDTQLTVKSGQYGGAEFQLILPA